MEWKIIHYNDLRESKVIILEHISQCLDRRFNQIPQIKQILILVDLRK